MVYWGTNWAIYTHTKVKPAALHCVLTNHLAHAMMLRQSAGLSGPCMAHVMHPNHALTHPWPSHIHPRHNKGGYYLFDWAGYAPWAWNGHYTTPNRQYGRLLPSLISRAIAECSICLNGVYVCHGCIFFSFSHSVVPHSAQAGSPPPPPQVAKQNPGRGGGGARERCLAD